MHQRKVKSLKWRILRNVSLILVLAMTVSTAVAYAYFAKVSRDQVLRDEGANLRQFTNQISFMVRDIVSFSKSIAVDNAIQKDAQITRFTSSFEEIKTQKAVANQLVFYNSLRTFIGDSFLICTNGNTFSSRGFYEERYYEDKLSVPQMLEYEKDGTMLFSNPYLAQEDSLSDPVICYKLVVKNIQRPVEQLGTLYLNIYLSYFKREFMEYAKPYEKVIWMENQGNLLYQSREESNGNIYLTAMQQHNGKELIPVQGGYLVKKPVDGTNWTVGVVISNQYLWQKSQFVMIFFVLFFAITITLMILSMNSILKGMINPITRLTKTMARVREKELDVEVYNSSNDEITLLYEGFNDMIGEIQGYMQEKLEHEKQKKELEFDILLSQINPHYLYNVLNTVVYMAAAEGNKQIVKLVNSLIRTLQESLEVGENHLYTTVQREIEVVDSYLTIQNYRYPGMFEVRTEVGEGLQSCSIPKTIIQPLIENAIMHGIIPTEHPGTVWLSIQQTNGSLMIEVKDNGIGMEAEVIRLFEEGTELPYQDRGRKHIGIRNIQDRIVYLYGADYGIHITSSPGEGSCIQVMLPCSQ